MATEMISLKLDSSFLYEVDSVVQKEGYQNRTEFIRDALREKMDEIRLRKALFEIVNKDKNVSEKELVKAKKLAISELKKRV